MMRTSMMLFLGCLGWLAGLDVQNTQAGVFCHNSCCSLVAGRMAAPVATNFAAPAPATAANGAAAESPAPAAFAYVVQSSVPVGPQLVVYGIPQCYLSGSVPQNAPRVFQNLLDEAQLINSVLGAVAQPPATVQSAPPSGDLASVRQDIRNLQSDVAMLKNRCLSNQGGSPASSTPTAQPAPPPTATAASGGASLDVARLAEQIQRLSETLTEQNRRLDQLAADVQGLKAHSPAASLRAPPVPPAGAPPAAR